MGTSLGKFANFWSGSRFNPDDEREIEPLMQDWRAAALFTVLIVIAVLGAPAFVSPVLNAVRRGEATPIVWIYLFVYAALVGLAVLPRLDFRLRVWGFLIMAYLNAAASFTRLGLAGSGRLYLLILPMIAMLLVGPQGSILATGLSLLIYVLFTALAHLGLLANWLTIQSNPLDLWFWVEAGIALLVMLVLINALNGRFYALLIGALAERKRAVSALEQATRELKEREERFALVMQGTNDGIWDWNLLTDEVYYSPRWKNMLGLKEDEISNHFEEWRHRVHPDDLEHALATIQNHLQSDAELYELEHRLRHNDGTYRWILARGFTLRDELGKPYRLAGSHTDITARKQAEEERMQSEKDMRSLMENAKDFAIYRIAVDPTHPYRGKVVITSPSMQRLVGISDLSNFSAWFDNIHPDDLPRIIEANRRSLETGASFDEQLRFWVEARNGWVWAHIRSTPVFDEQGILTHFNGLVVDITEQKHVEEALRTSELRFRAVFEGAPIGISVTSLEGRLVETNRALQQMFGYTGEELFDLEVPEFTYPEDADKDADLFYNQLVPGKRDHYQLEKRFIRKDGSIFWGRLSLSLARDAEGEPQFAIATTEDISEQKQAQKELQQAYETLELRVKERTRDLAFLNTISAAVSRSLDLKDILNEALNGTLEAMRMGCGGAYRLEGEQENEWLGVGSESIATEKLYLNPLVYRGLSDKFINFTGRLPYHGSGVQAAARMKAPMVWEVRTSPADPDMQSALIAEGIEQVISVPLMVKGSVVGAIQLGSSISRPYTSEELSLLAAVGQQVGVAVENARLYEQVQKTAILEERGRLARELHDSVTQSIYSVTLYAEAASRLLKAGDVVTVADHLRELRNTAQDALREMRLLIFELRPLALDKSGLVGGLRTRLETVEARSGIKTDLHVEGDEQLPYAAVVELYQVIQEALNNVLKHAGAKNIRIRLRFLDMATCLEIEDDGTGFIVETAKQSGGMGLSGMAERVHRLSGDFNIESAPGKGTHLCIEIPRKFEGDANIHSTQVLNEVN
jgi:PAS domain S-box-containing protein